MWVPQLAGGPLKPCPLSSRRLMGGAAVMSSKLSLGVLDHRWGWTNVFPSSVIIQTPGVLSPHRPSHSFNTNSLRGFQTFSWFLLWWTVLIEAVSFFRNFTINTQKTVTETKPQTRPLVQHFPGISSASFFSHKLYLPAAHEDVNTVWPSSLSLLRKGWPSLQFAITCFPFLPGISAGVSVETSIVFVCQHSVRHTFRRARLSLIFSSC